jgi:isovaleryl-CoA dehydrogenase
MLFDTHLTEEFDALRDTVKRMCDAELAPRAAAIDATNEIPADMWKKLGELGLLGMTVPDEYGGTGLGYVAHVVAMEEVSRASASVGLSYGAHSNLCVNNLYLNGPCATQEVPAQALLGRVRGRARDERAGRGLRRRGLDGLQGREERRPLGRQRLEDVDHQRPGCRRRDRLHAHGAEGPGLEGDDRLPGREGHEGIQHRAEARQAGMRGSNTCELVFQDCEIPEENVLGTRERRLEGPHEGPGHERCVLSGGPLGIMQAAMDLVLPYMHERKQFGQPIGTFELMQGKVADMYTRLQASRAFSYRVAGALDAGRGRARARMPPRACSSPRRTRCRWPSRRSSASAATATSTNSRGAPVARRQALRHRRGHQRDPPHAHRSRSCSKSPSRTESRRLPWLKASSS